MKSNLVKFDYILWGFVLFIIICASISCCGYVYNKRPNSRVDDSRYYSVLLFGLHCFDLVSDIILAMEMITKLYHSENNPIVLSIAAYGSVFFIVIPYCANIIIAANIKRMIGENYAAKMYFERYSSLFISL
eukprot:478716_1